ncbi:MAG: polysaccharide biosynthesis tyrosine autokinase [Phycisphaerae bacterium]|nr:polysaccharide biosynthesis tyrosine autokinase [Phycisphaerae bacterium]
METDPNTNPFQLFLHYGKVVLARKVILIAVLAAAIFTGILITRSMPKTYRATCLIQVQPETPDIDPFSNKNRARFDENFLLTQFELIQSDQVVEEVVRVLKLTRVLHPDVDEWKEAKRADAFHHTVKLVSGSIKVQQKKDTDLIEITVNLDRPRQPVGEAAVWAARVANTVGKVFKDQTRRRSRETTEQALKELQREIESLDEQIAKTERQLDTVRERYNVTDARTYTSSTLGTTTLNAHILVQAETARARAEIELQQKRVLLEQVLALKDQEVVSALPLLVDSKALTSLVTERRNAEIQISGQLRSLGPKHRSVERTRALIDDLTNKINEEVRGIRAGLQADYQAAKAAYDHISRYAEKLKEQERQQAGSGYREYRNLCSKLESLQKRRKTWEESYIRERLKLRLPHTSVDIIQKAKLNYAAAPVSPNALNNMAISVFLGLFLSIGIILLLEFTDSSVKTVEEVRRHLKARVLGVIPRKVRLLNLPNAPPMHFEAYRALRTNIKSLKQANDGHVLCLTSAAAGEGKSQTLFNLAYVCAQLGDRVLIVDANLHRPNQHQILHTDLRPGLGDLLLGEATLRKVVQTTSLPALHLLPSGTLRSESVHGLFESNTMKEVIRELKKNYDWILFDSSPLIGTCDAADLVRLADAVVLVVQHRKHPRALLQRAREMIETLGGTLLGVVLNNMNLSRDDSHYKYHIPYPDEEKAEKGRIKLWRSDEERKRHIGA